MRCGLAAPGRSDGRRAVHCALPSHHVPTPLTHAPGELVTCANGDASEKIGRPVEEGQMCLVSPRADVIVLHLYDGQLKVRCRVAAACRARSFRAVVGAGTPWTKHSPPPPLSSSFPPAPHLHRRRRRRGSHPLQVIPVSETGALSEAFNIKIDELKLINMCFLCADDFEGYPTLAVLFEDTSHQRHVKTYSLSVKGKVWARGPGAVEVLPACSRVCSCACGRRAMEKCKSRPGGPWDDPKTTVPAASQELLDYRWSQANLDERANLLIPVQGSDGALVVGESTVVFLGQNAIHAAALPPTIIKVRGVRAAASGRVGGELGWRALSRAAGRGARTAQAWGLGPPWTRR